MKKAKISIIIPVYNVAAFIGECIDSLIGQAFQDIEIICVDDGSTDGTLEVLKAYSEKDSRIKVIRHDHNQGVSVARNRGIEEANGEYILFVDSDDYHQDGSLQLLYDTVRDNELDVVQFELEAFITSGEPGFINMNPAARVQSVGKILSGPEMMVLQFEAKEYSCSVVLQMFRAGLLKDTTVRFFPGIIHEDEMFTPLVLENAKRVMCINDRLYKRRIRSNSIMTTALTHRNADGYFVVATELMARYIAGGRWNEGLGIRAKAILGSSLNRYKMLSDEEKQLAGKDIPEVYRFLFDRSLIRIEDEKNRSSHHYQQIREMQAQIKESQQQLREGQQQLAEKQKQLKEAQGQITVLRQKNAELNKLYTDIENSVSFKIGRIITSIPRKLRDFAKRILKK